MGWGSGSAARYRSIAAITVAALAGAALAQDNRGQDSGGTVLTFGISETLRSDSNLYLQTPSPGRSTVLDTGLNFGLSSVGRVQQLELDLFGTYRIGDTPDGAKNNFQTPGLRLSYDRQGARSTLGLTADWRSTDLDLLSAFADPLVYLDPDTGEIVVASNTGSVETISSALSFETGIDMPVGLIVDARYWEKNYHNTIDPDLFDSHGETVSVKGRVDFSPVISAGLRLTQRRYYADDSVDTRRRTESYLASITYDIDAATQVEGGLGQSRVTTDKTTGTEIETGLTASFDLTRELRNGSVGLSFDRTIRSTGPRDVLAVSRQMALPRGELDFNIGASHGNSGTNMVGFINYSLALKRDALRLNIARTVSTSSDNEDLVVTRATAGWQHELTALASLRLNISYAMNEGTNQTDRIDQTNLTLAYDHQLTRDWMFSTGYEYRAKNNEGGDDPSSNAVFMTLGRSFSIRP